MGGVAGEGLGVAILKGFEVVVDGMPHHDLPCEDLQDLELAWKRGWPGGSGGALRPPPGFSST